MGLTDFPGIRWRTPVAESAAIGHAQVNVIRRWQRRCLNPINKGEFSRLPGAAGGERMPARVRRPSPDVARRPQGSACSNQAKTRSSKFKACLPLLATALLLGVLPLSALRTMTRKRPSSSSMGRKVPSPARSSRRSALPSTRRTRSSSPTSTTPACRNSPWSKSTWATSMCRGMKRSASRTSPTS